jgi:hypothetical protein
MPLSNEKGYLFSRKNPLGVGTWRLPPKGFEEVGYKMDDTLERWIYLIFTT